MAALNKGNYWKQVIKEQEESGLTLKAWCEETQIKRGTYHYWKKRIREEEEPAASTGRETIVFAKIKTEELSPMKLKKLQIKWKELELEITSKEDIPLAAEFLQYMQETC